MSQSEERVEEGVVAPTLKAFVAGCGVALVFAIAHGPIEPSPEQQAHEEQVNADTEALRLAQRADMLLAPDGIFVAVVTEREHDNDEVKLACFGETGSYHRLRDLAIAGVHLVPPADQPEATERWKRQNHSICAAW